MPASTPSNCLHLGLSNDRTVARTVPDSDHRCYATRPPHAPDETYQSSFCLSAGHTACPFYMAPAAAGYPAAPQPSPRRAAPRRMKWVWLLVAALLVVVAAVYAWDLLRPPAAAPAALVAAATPGAAAAPTAMPAAVTRRPRPEPAQPAAPRTTGAEAAAATAEPGGRSLTLAPERGLAGWWSSGDARGNHLGDSFLYAGYYDGQTMSSAMRFDLAALPRGAPIREAQLRLTGLNADRFDPGAGGAWTVQLLPADALEDFARADFQALYNTPAAVTLFPTLYPADLDQGGANVLAFDASARHWLEAQVLAGAPAVVARITGPAGGGSTLFAWDSGLGPATLGEAPQLLLTLGAAPATPPPLPTEIVTIATLTPTPANVLTVAAQVGTAAAAAGTTGTPTPAGYRLVTPTPIPANMATAQALSLAQGLPAIVASTSVPANAATATDQALYATAVAVTTGTFTPVPTDAVTPVVVLPTPMPENVVTAAAQMRTATAQAARSASATPLPFNAVIATLTPAPLVFLDTATPQNAATAQALSAYATAVAVTTGTFTPMPPGAVRATRTPVATPLPLVLYLDRLTPTVRPTPTATTPSATAARAGGQDPLCQRPGWGPPACTPLDPATGRLAYVTQSWPFALAQAREPLSPDGFARIAVANDGRDNPQLYVHDTRYQGARQLTSTAAWSYDPAWSPRGDRIAYVSQETGNDEIFLIGLDGSNVQRLTNNNWEWDKHPSWSPDGSQIVFWSNRETGRRQLWIMNADGSKQRPLLDSPYNDWDPIWVK